MPFLIPMTSVTPPFDLDDYRNLRQRFIIGTQQALRPLLDKMLSSEQHRQIAEGDIFFLNTSADYGAGLDLPQNQLLKYPKESQSIETRQITLRPYLDAYFRKALNPKEDSTCGDELLYFRNSRKALSPEEDPARLICRKLIEAAERRSVADTQTLLVPYFGLLECYAQVLNHPLALLPLGKRNLLQSAIYDQRIWNGEISKSPFTGKKDLILVKQALSVPAVETLYKALQKPFDDKPLTPEALRDILYPKSSWFTARVQGLCQSQQALSDFANTLIRRIEALLDQASDLTSTAFDKAAWATARAKRVIWKLFRGV